MREPVPLKTVWPAPLSRAAYVGIFGTIVDALAPETAADPAGILLQVLALSSWSAGFCGVLRASSIHEAASRTDDAAFTLSLRVGRSDRDANKGDMEIAAPQSWRELISIISNALKIGTAAGPGI